MESSAEFDLKSAINSWEQSNLSKQELTPSDIKELKENFLIAIDEMKSNGLTEEEAFAATSVRFGSKRFRRNNVQIFNEDSFQLKKLVLLFGGALYFLLSKYLIIALHRTSLIILNNFRSDFEANINAVHMGINVVYFLFILLILVSFFEKNGFVINFIARIKFNRKRVITLFILVIVLFGVQFNLTPAMRNSIINLSLVGHFFLKERWFEVVFPFLFGIEFIILYFKYRKSAEV